MREGKKGCFLFLSQKKLFFKIEAKSRQRVFLCRLRFFFFGYSRTRITVGGFLAPILQLWIWYYFLLAIILPINRVPLYFGKQSTQPTKVQWEMQAQSEHVHVAHMFLHVWRRFVCSVSAY